MEEEKKTKMNMSTFLLIVAMFVIICMAIFMYVQKINSDREIEILKNSGAELQEKVTELQGKMNNISEVASSTTEDKVNTTPSSNSNDLKIMVGEYYDSIIDIREAVEGGLGDGSTGEVKFESNGEVYIAYDVVYGVKGTYTISGDIITCKLTSLLNEGQKEKDCDYTVQYKLLHSRGIKVINSELKYENKDIYSIDDMLVCFR